MVIQIQKPRIRNKFEALVAFKTHKPNSVVFREFDFGYLISYQNKRYLLMFKRDFYKSFKHHFKHIPEMRNYGYAQIMNLSMLKMAIEDGIEYVAFAMPTGNIYQCNPRLFLKFYEKYHTEVPHLKGEVALPLNFFERLDKNELQ